MSFLHVYFWGRYPAYHNIGVRSWIIYSPTILTFVISHCLFLHVLYHTWQYSTVKISHFAFSSLYNISLQLNAHLKYYTQWVSAGIISHLLFVTRVLSHSTCMACEISYLRFKLFEDWILAIRWLFKYHTWFFKAVVILHLTFCSCRSITLKLS